MADIDLGGMSKSELLALQKKIAKAIETYETRRKEEALAVVAAKAAELGYSLQELVKVQKGNGRQKTPPKYRDPNNPSNTWSGFGRPPQWLKAALEDGSKTKDDFLIAA